MSTQTFTAEQQALIEQHRDINVDHNWWGCTYDDFIEVAKAYGITVHANDISFSGFWSQGDGASFTFGPVNLYYILMSGITVDREKPFGEEPTGYAAAFRDLWAAIHDKYLNALVDAEARVRAENLLLSCHRNSHRYSHAGTCEARLECDDGSDSYSCEEQKSYDSLVEDIANALYSTLEDEYDHLTADAQVWEAIVANGLDEDLRVAA